MTTNASSPSLALHTAGAVQQQQAVKGTWAHHIQCSSPLYSKDSFNMFQQYKSRRN